MKLFCRKDLGPHPHEHSAISELPDWSYAGKRKNLFTYTLLVHVLSTSVKRLFWLSDGRHAPLTPGTLKKRLEMEEFTVRSAGRVTVLQHQIKNTLFQRYGLSICTIHRYWMLSSVSQRRSFSSFKTSSCTCDSSFLFT